LRRRAAALYKDCTSRVTGDCHARICEGLGVQVPGPTRRAPRAKRVGDRRLVLRNCVVDEGRSLGVVLQEKAPNHLPLLRPKAVVVSREGKGPRSIGSGDSQEEER
jgi:hypothetical protein